MGQRFSSVVRRHFSGVRPTWAALAVVAWAGVIVNVGIAVETEPLPTSVELHKLFDDAQYQPLSVKLTRVLQFKGDAARGYDHVDLGTLRADTLLELKQQPTAVTAIAEAVKAINEQTDPKVASRARATQVLLKYSPALAYTPKLARPGETIQPISLLDMTQRKTAYAALLRDMRAEVTARAKAAKTLPAIILAGGAISDMRAVELEAGASDTASQSSADELAARAKTLMADAVTAMSKRAKEIDTDANTLLANPTQPRIPSGKTGSKSTGTVAVAPTYHKKGLDTRSRNELKDIVDTCTKVQSAAKDFEEVSKQNAAGFRETSDSADKTSKAATATLDADYRGNQIK